MTNETRFSLCPNCDACPEVAVTDDVVMIGEEGNQVRLAHDEWNVLVGAIKSGDLDMIEEKGSAGNARHASCC
jgi:hypothetical protein